MATTKDSAAIINNIFKNLSITKPAIDVVNIAKYYDIKVTYEEFDDGTDGLLLIKNGNPVIAVNSEQHPNRQRFSIAHELGHFFLHAEGKKDGLFVDKSLYHRNDQSSMGTIQDEIEANKFAAALLMPESMLISIIKDENLDLSDDFDLYLLAEKFGVSEKAMGYRLGNLGLCF